MEKNKRKMVIIVSVVLIIILVSLSLMYFYSSKNNMAIKSTLKTYNAELNENEHMHLEEDLSGDKVPVPNGYVGSKATGENEIDTGYVIYEGTDEVNDSNVEEAQKTRNQYVWIPVPEPSKMYGTDANGKKWGKLYEFTTDTGDGIDAVTGAKPLNWSESNGILKIISKTGYREPDVMPKYGNSIYDMNSKMKELEIEEKTAHGFLIKIEKDFNNMMDSVEKYGGFYIGRYETGNLKKEEVVVRKGNIDTMDGQNLWYTMYLKCKMLNNNNFNIETRMMWGNQWDRILMWLIESGNKSKEEICKDSTNWGNYQNAEFEYIDINDRKSKKNKGDKLKIPTGNSEYTKANNIYDLAGNTNEWTMEGFSSDNRVYRGGDRNNLRLRIVFKSSRHIWA